MFGGNLVISQPSKDKRQRWGATSERMTTGILCVLWLVTPLGWPSFLHKFDTIGIKKNCYLS